MAKNKINAGELTLDELNEQLAGAEESYQQMQFDHVTTGLDNPLTLVEVRRDIARLKTELRKREVAEYTPEQLAGRSKKVARRKREKQAAKRRKR